MSEKWKSDQKLFIKLVKENPILYKNTVTGIDEVMKGNIRNLRKMGWEAVSAEMNKHGYKLLPSSCIAKLRRIRQEFEAMCKMSQVERSVLGSKYLDGTLNFLLEEENNDHNRYVQHIFHKEVSSNRLVGYEYPPISLLSSDSESDSGESPVTHVNQFSNYFYDAESAKQFNKSPGKAQHKTIVSIDMIKALLKNKTDSAYADPAGPMCSNDTIDDNARDLSANFSIHLHQSTAKSVDIGTKNVAIMNSNYITSVKMSDQPQVTTTTKVQTTNYLDISYEENNNCKRHVQHKLHPEASCKSPAGFEYPPISLLSSDSESESKESTVTHVKKFSNCTYGAHSNRYFNKSTNKAVRRRTVTVDMIKALLKDKTVSSYAETSGPIVSNNAINGDASNSSDNFIIYVHQSTAKSVDTYHYLSNK